MNTNTKAHICVFIANILYGINYAFAKYALNVFSPFGLVLSRVIISLILFGCISLFIVKEKIDAADHKKMIVCALFGVACNQLMFIAGLNLTSEIHAALIMITTPLLVLVIAWILLKEKITVQKILGIFIGAAGVYTLIMGSTNPNATSNVSGDILIMLNASSYAIFLVLAKPLMKKYSPFTVIFWIFFYGFFMVLPFGFNSVIHIQWFNLPQKVFLSWLYVVMGATFFAYLFNTLGLNYGSPALVSIYIYIQPVIATLVAVILHTDTLTITKIISSVFIFSGVALVSFSFQQKPVQQKTTT